MAQSYAPSPAGAATAALPGCIPASSAHLHTHIHLDAQFPPLSSLDSSHSAVVDHATHLDSHHQLQTNADDHGDAENDDFDPAAISYYTPAAWIHLAHYPSPSFFLSTPKPQTSLPTPTSSPQSSPSDFAMTALPGYEDFSLFGDEPLLPQAPASSSKTPAATQQPPSMPASSSTYSTSSSIVHLPSSSAMQPPAPSSTAAPAPATSTAGAIGGISFLPEWHPTSLLSPSFTPATVFDSPDMGYDASALFSPALLDSAASPYMADAASPLLGEDAAASFASALPHAAAQLFPDLATSQPPPPPPTSSSSATPAPPSVSRPPPPTSTADQIHQHQIQAWVQQQAAHAQAALRQQQAQQQQYAAAAAAAAARMQGMVAVPGMHSPAIAQWYSPAAVAYAAFPTSTPQQPLAQAPMVRPAAPASAMASPYLAMQSTFGGGTGSPLIGGSGLIAAQPQPLQQAHRVVGGSGMQYQQQQMQRPAPSAQYNQQPAPPAAPAAAPAAAPKPAAPASASSSAPSSTVGKSTRSKPSPNVTTSTRRKRPAPDYDGTATTAAVAAALAAQAQAQADAAAAARAAAATNQAQSPPAPAPKANGLASPPRSSTTHLAPPPQQHTGAGAVQGQSPMTIDSSHPSPLTAESQSLTPDPTSHAHAPHAGPASATSTTTGYRAASSISDMPHAPTSPPMTSHSDTSVATGGTASSSTVANVDSLPTLDPIARKRAKNTDAARRSRLKKMQRMETLEERVQQLEDENKALTLQLAVCENDKKNWEAKEDELKARIAYLEDKLFAGMATATATARRDREGGAAAAGARRHASRQ